MKQWQNFYAFSKVKSCIEALVAEVSTTLEHSLDEQDGGHMAPAQFELCASHLAQIGGVLRAMEYREFALFADEMLGLLNDANALASASQMDRATEALQTLFVAINDFSALMEGVLSRQINCWSEFSVPFNRMRKARGLGLIFASQALLTKQEIKFSELFASRSPKMKALVDRYASYYEEACKLISTGRNPAQGISVLANVFTNLEIVSRDYRYATLWGLCATLLESVPQEQANAHPAVQLLCSFSSLMQDFRSHGYRVLDQNIPDEILEKLLDAFSGPLQDNDRLQAVRLWFSLDIRLSREHRKKTQGIMVGYFRKGAFQKVIRLLLDNTHALSLQINDHINGQAERSEPESIAVSLETIQRTVEALGMSTLAHKVGESLAHYSEHPSSALAGSEPGDALDAFLSHAAQSLYQCEVALSARAEEIERAIFVSTAGTREDAGITGTRLTVVLEAIKNLELVLICINRYAEAQCSKPAIEEAAALLESAQGALRTVPVERAVAYAAGARAFVERTLACEGKLELDKPFHDFTQLIINTILYLEQFTIGCAEDLTHIVQESDQLLQNIEDFPRMSAGAWQVTQVQAITPEEREIAVESIAEIALPVEEIEIAADPVDEDIREIFIEEAEEILQELRANYDALSADPENAHALAELRRNFHTLKGSGLMVKAKAIAAVAWSIENLLNHVISGSVPVSSPLLSLLGEVRNELPSLISNFRAANPSSFDAEYITQVEELAADLLSAPAPQPEEQPDLMCEMFVTESERQVALIRELLDSSFNVDVHGQVITTTSYLIPVHTLYGNKRIADFHGFGHSVSQLERLLQDNPYRKINAALKELLREFCTITASVTEAVRSAGTEASEAGEEPDIDSAIIAFVARLDQIQASFAAPGTSAFSGSRMDSVEPVAVQATEPLPDAGAELALLMQGFLSEAKTSSALIASLYETFSASQEAKTARQLQEQFQLLEGAAALADQHALAALSHTLCATFKQYGDGMFTLDYVTSALLDQALGTLSRGMQALQQEESFPSVTTLCGSLQEAVTKRTALHLHESDREDEDEIEEAMLAVFLDEADKILQDLDNRLADWRQAPDERGIADELLRLLHTLKGSAALVGQQQLSDCAHEFESLIIRSVRESINDDVLTQSDAFLATLQNQFALYQRGDETVSQSETAADGEVALLPVAESNDKAEAITEAPAPAPASNIIALRTERAPVAAGSPVPSSDAAPVIDEHVRVSGNLLRTLLNDADEIGIARNRVEQNIVECNTLMHEMDETLGRLQGYIRAFEEHGSQLALEGASQGTTSGFDALEMDRYTELQQISLALLEDYDDLKDIRNNLAGKVRSMDMVLAEQQRATNKLQDGLISSQMVPFAGIVPRLRRLTQQVSAELKKQVSIRFSNPEGKIDRSVLQVIINPIEHMIRNAIDHGIEAPAERAAAGKPAQAEILVKLYRQGANILLDISDDGTGINTAKIRQRAIAEGIIGAEEQLPDRDIIQLILRAGFTTSDTVSRISGRGVGLDVVQSEIAQIGGDIDILSTPGLGTTFRIRLPLTASLNRALLFTVQGSDYVILLNTIDGIILEKVDALRGYYEQDTMPLFQYAGKSYEMAYLGGLVGGSRRPDFARGTDSSASLLLISGTHRSMALQVDSIIGSRELVVKSLGAQFAAVPSLSGGVILGDGRVAIVLDPIALVDHFTVTHGTRDIGTAEGNEEPRAQPVIELDTRKTVLVVDDSITVRKVTSAILKRNGMNVLLAKNGMEAVEILQSTTPDLMLLDIEMPQMDGFEVASYIRRQQSEVKDLPIIMITSRIGEKHRSKAAEIGVNQYMCKPFQEEYLLEAITECNA